MSIDDIKAEVRTGWGETPIADACVRIVDFISKLPEGERHLLTYGTLATALEKPSIDSDVLTVVAILVNSKISALDTWAMFIDDDGEEFEVEPNSLEASIASNEFIHPDTGEVVPDFEARLMPFFVPSERFGQRES